MKGKGAGGYGSWRVWTREGEGEGKGVEGSWKRGEGELKERGGQER